MWLRFEVWRKNSPYLPFGFANKLTFRVFYRDEVKTYTDGLKTLLNSIEKANEKLDPNEEREFNPLIPAHGKLLEFAIDMWKCFHVLYPFHASGQ